MVVQSQGWKFSPSGGNSNEQVHRSIHLTPPPPRSQLFTRSCAPCYGPVEDWEKRRAEVEAHERRRRYDEGDTEVVAAEIKEISWEKQNQAG